MATRLYYVAGTAPSVLPAFLTGWTDTTQAVRRLMSLAKDATVETRSGTLTGLTNANALAAQLQSPPLLGAQTITGTYEIVSRGRELDLADNINKRWRSLRVMSGDGVTTRGTIIATTASASTTELLATVTGQQHVTAGAVGTVNALDGDIIVLEIGYGESSTGTTPQWEVILGGTGTDHLNANGDTTGTVAWMEFSQNLVFHRLDAAAIPAFRSRKFYLPAPWRREQVPFTQEAVAPPQDNTAALSRMDRRAPRLAVVERGRARAVVPSVVTPPPPVELAPAAYRPTPTRLPTWRRGRGGAMPVVASGASPIAYHRGRLPLAWWRRVGPSSPVPVPTEPPPPVELVPAAVHRRTRPALLRRSVAPVAVLPVVAPPESPVLVAVVSGHRMARLLSCKPSGPTAPPTGHAAVPDASRGPHRRRQSVYHTRSGTSQPVRSPEAPQASPAWLQGVVRSARMVALYLLGHRSWNVVRIGPPPVQSAPGFFSDSVSSGGGTGATTAALADAETRAGAGTGSTVGATMDPDVTSGRFGQ